METSSPTTKVNAEKIGENSDNKKTNLPEDIVTDIISRLSAKPVFQLQCLSKNFTSITKNCNFIQVHLRQSAHLRPSIIVNRGFNMYLIQSNSLLEITVDEVPHHKVFEINNNGDMLQMLGSCNGLVVVAVGSSDLNCFIFNPVTLERDRLPTPSIIPDKHMLSAAWGFGYCAKSKVYKIVRIASWYTTYYKLINTYYTTGSQLVVDVLSYGTDKAWRTLDFSKFDQICDGHGITVKGVVYWIPVSTEHNRDKLLKFDLEKEDFAWILCPVSAAEQIMEFNGTIAVCVDSKINKNVFEIWVLKDGGQHGDGVNTNSWEKIYTIDKIFPCMPLLFLNDRQLFLYNRWNELSVDNCCLYDLECKEVKKIPQVLIGSRYAARYIMDGVYLGDHGNTFEALNFVESLVPLLPPEDDGHK